MKKSLAFTLICLFLTVIPALAGTFGLIEKEELKALLGSENLVILDVRAGRDWSTSEFKIQGAIRADGSEFQSWAESYPKNAKLVLYCA